LQLAMNKTNKKIVMDLNIRILKSPHNDYTIKKN
jgi:hypothetical protein